MIITKALIEQARTLGACSSGLRQAEEHIGQELENLAPEYILWCAQHTSDIAPDTLRKCAEKEPYAALKYAAKLLDPNTLRTCAEKYPYVALKYAAKFLDSDTLRECADAANLTNVRTIPAVSRPS